VANRHRRRERYLSAEERGAKSEKRASRSADKRRTAFLAQQRSLGRRRTFVGALGFLPLVGWLGCASGIDVLCVLPRDWWLAVFAALFGSYLGLTIRLVLERRKWTKLEGGAAPVGSAR